MADDKIRLRRKADNFYLDPMTEAEAKKLDGYPGDFERITPPKPIDHKDVDAAETKPKRSRKPRAKPTTSPAATEPVAADTADTGE